MSYPPSTQFPKGTSGSPENQFKEGNPGGPGRPPGIPLRKLLEHRLSEKIKGDKKGRTYGDKLIEEVVKRATYKSDTLAKEIFDRIDGKVAAPVTLSGPDGAPIPVSISEIDAKIAELLSGTDSSTASGEKS